MNALAHATRFLPGGRAEFLEGVSRAMLEQLPAATNWWMVYAKLLPSHRLTVSFDDVCIAAGVRPSQLMAEVISCTMEFGQDVGQLTSAAMHPVLVHQLAKSAKRIGGEYADIAQKDRHAFLQARGFLPVPRNVSVAVHANANASAQSTAQSAAVAASAADPSVPSFAATMEALRGVRGSVQKQIEARAAEAQDTDLIVEADLVPEAVES